MQSISFQTLRVGQRFIVRINNDDVVLTKITNAFAKDDKGGWFPMLTGESVDTIGR